ncbi:hypothetical protein [Streptococcus infantarius]|uniref:hypothetical protein n=1 Tax=Streptococcus infantarius TaxID=102684 RepID=UPI0022E7502C|nr:hypothetical protein [Streptococcus infantarius]
MKKNTWKKMVLAGAGLTLAGSVLVACSNNSSTLLWHTHLVVSNSNTAMVS